MIIFLVQTLLQASWAQEDSKEKVLTFEELGYVPTFQVAAFLDRPNTGDCDRIDARYGRCIEIVDFYNPVPVWSALDGGIDRNVLPYLYPNNRIWVNSSKLEQEHWKKVDLKTSVLLAELYAQTWEDIVYRWKEDADEMATVFRNEGFKVSPDPISEWETWYPNNHSAMGRVKSSAYIYPYDWMQTIFPLTSTSVMLDADETVKKTFFAQYRSVTVKPNAPTPSTSSLLDSLQARPAYYPRVKHAVPKGGTIEPTASIVLRGRFAQRLGVQGRLHDYDMMDAEPASSGPFFEQIYPYQTVYRQDNPNFIPLTDFRYKTAPNDAKSVVPQVVLAVNNLEEARVLSEKEFNSFYRLVGAQVMQFAMQDYTVNHMRIMATLTTMRTPPGELGATTGMSKDINASSLGQTDSTEEQAKRIKDNAYSLPGGFSLNYQKIPDVLIVQWLERLSILYLSDSEKSMFYRELTMIAEGRFVESLRQQRVSFIEGVSEEQLKGWIDANLEVGRDGNVILAPLRQLALQMLMAKVVPENFRGQEETWLLMDHLNYSIASNMDTTVGMRVAPTELADLTSSKWESVLKDHYYATQRIEQGLGAIDPTAVCTTGNRLQALSETTIGAVYVDQMFFGEDINLNPDLTNDDLLWAAKYNLPFLMFDSPRVNEPSVQRLIGLPDGRALYRAQWTVWTGWHFLWGVEKFEDRPRLVLKTAAICDNMVLASPDIVPTIVRAGLLEDQFYPTEPARPGDKKYNDDYPSLSERQANRRKNKQKKDVERTDAIAGVRKGWNRGKRAVDKTQRTVDFIENPDLTASQADQLSDSDAANSQGLAKTSAQIKALRRPVKIQTNETAEYFKGLARDPLEQKSENTGLIVIVHDLDQPEKFEFLYDGLAHTPYARAHEMVGLQHIQGAAWAVYFDKDPASDKVTKIAPAYIPRPSYTANAVTPSFRREQTTDATFVADVGFFPYRQSKYSCNDTVSGQNLYAVEACDASKEYTAITDGLSVGLASYVTKWVSDDPRLAYEVGLEMHLDMLHAGEPWFYQSNSPDMSIVIDRLNGKDVGTSRDRLVFTPSYTWSLRPQTGASFGIRHIPDPMPFSRMGQTKTTWGAMGPSGTALLRRMEWGLRGGMLLGPSFNGVEGTLVAEAWGAHIIRNPRSDWAYFTPYHPISNGGIFLRYQRGGVLIPNDTPQMFNLLYSDTFLIGWRSHFRLPEPRPE